MHVSFWPKETDTLERALADLENLLRRQPVDASRLVTILDGLFVLLSEGEQRPGQYLANVIERHPNWYADVEQLRQERETLLGELQEVCEVVEQRARNTDVTEGVCSRLERWRMAIDRHRMKAAAVMERTLPFAVEDEDGR